MSFPTKAAVDAKIMAVNYEIEKERGLIDIKRAFPDVMRCTGTDNMIVEICSKFVGADVAPSLPVFRSAVEEDPTVLNALSTTTVPKQIRALLDEVEGLLRSVSANTDAIVRSEMAKLRYATLEELTARRDRIVEAQRLSRLSVPQIKAELKNSRPTNHRYHPYSLLPPPSELPSAALYKMFRDGDARKIVRMYGSPQCTDRLQGRS
jgi:hypothetical protein